MKTLYNTVMLLQKKQKQFAKKAEKQNLLFHTSIIGLCSILGLGIFFGINQFILPSSLPLPKTTAINWLVMHHHSLTLDYIRFTVFVVVMLLTVICGWFFALWIKSRY